MTQPPYDFGEFRRLAHALSGEHRQAIDAAETAGRAHAKAEAEYHKQLAVAVARLKATHGATTAETLAKGEALVQTSKLERDESSAVDRAAMERIRLCRDDRAVLLTMGAWSRSAGDWDA